MTNPKHTSSDLVEWCSQDLPCARYQALEAENERLREALEWYVAEDAKYMRAALNEDTRHD